MVKRTDDLLAEDQDASAWLQRYRWLAPPAPISHCPPSGTEQLQSADRTVLRRLPQPGRGRGQAQIALAAGRAGCCAGAPRR
jgi:hypothetical protein